MSPIEKQTHPKTADSSLKKAIIDIIDETIVNIPERTVIKLIVPSGIFSKLLFINSPPYVDLY
jgi:hypothetical protein